MSQPIQSDRDGRIAKSNPLSNIINNNLHNFSYIDWFIVGLVILITLIGLVAIYSATMYKNSTDDLATQTASLFIGIALMAVLVYVPIQWIKSGLSMGFSNVIVLILLLYTNCFGEIVNGARSWITIFITFQPSELFKVTSILMIAWSSAYVNREEILSQRKFPKFVLLGTVLMFVSGLLLIGSQPDFGMAVIIGGSIFITFSLLHASPKRNLTLFATLILVYGLFYFWASNNSEWLINQNFHVFSRIAVFTNPFNFSQEEGYQLIEGFKAIQAGGLFGVGLGNGQAKYGSLPAIETDFIIANIAEESGFVGILIVLGLLFTLILFLYQRAAKIRDLQERAIVVGVATMMLIQIGINIAGMLSFIPLTGVTLPFISYGGTSLIVSYIMIGLALRMIIESKKGLVLEENYQVNKSEIILVYSREDV